jgi:hypothetical protein
MSRIVYCGYVRNEGLSLTSICTCESHQPPSGTFVVHGAAHCVHKLLQYDHEHVLLRLSSTNTGFASAAAAISGIPCLCGQQLQHL